MPGMRRRSARRPNELFGILPIERQLRIDAGVHINTLRGHVHERQGSQPGAMLWEDYAGVGNVANRLAVGEERRAAAVREPPTDAARLGANGEQYPLVIAAKRNPLP